MLHTSHPLRPFISSWNLWMVIGACGSLSLPTATVTLSAATTVVENGTRVELNLS
ncbi:uncharacterized protein RHIMIDRAFT_277915 [Rhizopus microsporus ATCC 52813]|uniref:Uncharacterized protein n=1 Tax=Rhizopus microsporus ATCC 52813 TaxID=1340429 RepID=A0A2G4SYZ8_RHIZD|nr:uncharacterized protein RHIMIDRAFT_277915 [Rhizopus microsporus ATCC 52813]PHZ14009.1 hypothetical protein RHIMIDRAFT_277915 [Rhizopus microsporus ATCC 52813]